MDALGRFLAEQLNEIGAEVEIFPRKEVGDILYAAWNGNAPGKPILLLCHMDTVWPVGTLIKCRCGKATCGSMAPASWI